MYIYIHKLTNKISKNTVSLNILLILCFRKQISVVKINFQMQKTSQITSTYGIKRCYKRMHIYWISFRLDWNQIFMAKGLIHTIAHSEEDYGLVDHYHNNSMLFAYNVPNVCNSELLFLFIQEDVLKSVNTP